MTRANKPPVALYSALADVTRCRILEILRAGPVPVHRLSDRFSISRPAISRHLRVLKQAGLVAEVKKGRENLYAFKPKRLVGAQDWLAGLAAAPSEPEAEAQVVAVSEIVAPPEASAPIVVALPAPEIAPEPQAATPARRVRSPARTPAPEPAISQMGFDF